jgi:RNA polymerase sigma factor (sigma-70 family)
MDREAEFDLVRRLAAGDAAAFDEIYDAYRARLFTFLARLSRRRDVAEDLLEETWLRLVSHAGRIAPGTPLAPWLYTVARNLFYSYCRSRNVEDSRAAGLMGLWPLPTPEPSPFERASASELEARLERALAALPPIYREILELAVVAGLSASEISITCGVPPETCRQRLSRAREKLAIVLERQLSREKDPVLGEVAV